MPRTLMARTLSCCLLLLSAAPNAAQPERVGRPADAADDAAAEQRRPPLLSVIHPHRHEPAGATCQTWSVRVRHAKDLTFRLHVIRGGKRRVAQTVTYRWAKESWRPEADAVAGQVLVLLQEGRPFGAKAIQRASLSVSIDDDQLNLAGIPQREEQGEVAVLDADVAPQFTQVGGGHTIETGRERLLYGMQLDPPADTHSGGSRGFVMEDLIERSTRQPGLVFVAVTVEWRTFD